jgi:hypothetical protein
VLQQNLSVGRFAENGETLSRLAIANNSLVMAVRWLLILGIPVYLPGAAGQASQVNRWVGAGLSRLSIRRRRQLGEDSPRSLAQEPQNNTQTTGKEKKKVRHSIAVFLAYGGDGGGRILYSDGGLRRRLYKQHTRQTQTTQQTLCLAICSYKKENKRKKERKSSSCVSQLGRMSYYLLAFLYLFSSRLGIPTDTFPRTPAIDKPKSKTDPKRAIFERYSLLAALLDGWMMIYFQRGFHAWRSSSTGDGIGKPSLFFPPLSSFLSVHHLLSH